MSYYFTVGGHVESKKQEAEVLAAAADFAEKVGANGSFSFSGSHFSLASAPAQDGVAQAREKVAAYNAEADADDQVSPDSDTGEVETDSE